jgi:hypothetical protein
VLRAQGGRSADNHLQQMILQLKSHVQAVPIYGSSRHTSCMRSRTQYHTGPVQALQPDNFAAAIVTTETLRSTTASHFR